MSKTITSFIQTLETAAQAGELKQMCFVLFTEAEREEFTRRVRILQLLSEGKSQREVAAELGVGIATVTRGAKEFKSMKSSWRSDLFWRQ